MKLVQAEVAVWAAIALAACSSPPKPAAKETKAAAKPVEYFHVDPATAGAVGGRVTYHGAVPKAKKIASDSETACPQTLREETVVTGKTGGLANTFVYVQAGLEGKQFEPPSASVDLNQHGCMFVPRIVGIQTGQMIDVKNSDPISHNIHPMPTNNREWSQEQAPGSPDIEHKFPRPEVMIKVKCNIHSWMRAYLGVVSHPYFAVTGPDGVFELKNLPPGDYTLATWHETLGEKKQALHIDASGRSTLDFVYP